MMAAMVLGNLLYVVGAIVAATVISALILLRHRRPRSLEAGIELFSRELRALAPDAPRTRMSEDDNERPSGPNRGSNQAARARRYPPSNEAGAPSPDTEQQPG